MEKETNEEGKCIAMFFHGTVRSAITLALLFSNSKHPRNVHGETTTGQDGGETDTGAVSLISIQ